MFAVASTGPRATRIDGRRAYRAVAAVNLADGFDVLGIRGAIIPLFVRDSLHRPATWTGIGFGVFAALNAAALLPADDPGVT